MQGPCVETHHLIMRLISAPFLSSWFCRGKERLHVWPVCLSHLSTPCSFFLRNREQSQRQAISRSGVRLCLASLYNLLNIFDFQQVPWVGFP